MARRARVLLLLAEGTPLRQIQTQTGMNLRRLQHWKQCWQQRGLDGLHDAPRAGRPKKLTPEQEGEILAVTEKPPREPLMHWSSHCLARRVGVSYGTVVRGWHRVGLQPHRLRRYMATPDLGFEAKAKDILGLDLNPPRDAGVFCLWMRRRPPTRWLAANRRRRFDGGSRSAPQWSTSGMGRCRCLPP
ncbi:MAG: helix-turn-helix domain-containing protein [Acidobacteriia bacterium]|nr:helix-turn-helix domain-containing protein [Terriglobia bacterium]